MRVGSQARGGERSRRRFDPPDASSAPCSGPSRTRVARRCASPWASLTAPARGACRKRSGRRDGLADRTKGWARTEPSCRRPALCVIEPEAQAGSSFQGRQRGADLVVGHDRQIDQEAEDAGAQKVPESDRDQEHHGPAVRERFGVPDVCREPSCRNAQASTVRKVSGMTSAAEKNAPRAMCSTGVQRNTGGASCR